MAKARRRSAAVTVRRAPSRSNITVRVPGPVRRARRRRGGAGGGELNTNQLMGYAIGGLAVGWLDKQSGIPTIPILGRKGTIALGAYFLRRSSSVARDICKAAVVLSAYEFGREGRVSGEDYDDDES